jgi:serine/threonine protein kinase
MTQVGTPMWMAPEIIIGKQYTEKADVYAFGIILWEILTRLEPYEDKEPMQIVVEVVNDGLRPTLPDECKASPLVPLMKDCWHADPDQRPTFAIIVERLSKMFEDETKVHPLEKDEDDGEDPAHPGDNPNGRGGRTSKPQGGGGGGESKASPAKGPAGGGASAAAAAAPGGPPNGRAPGGGQGSPNAPKRTIAPAGGPPGK